MSVQDCSDNNIFLFDVFWCKSLPSPERDHVLPVRSSGPAVWVQIPILLLYHPGMSHSLYTLPSLIGQMFIEHLLSVRCCVRSRGYNGEQNGHDLGCSVAYSSVQEISNNDSNEFLINLMTEKYLAMWNTEQWNDQVQKATSNYVTITIRDVCRVSAWYLVHKCSINGSYC